MAAFCPWHYNFIRIYRTRQWNGTIPYGPLPPCPPPVFVLVAQSCPTLCDSVACSPPGSSAHGIFPGKNTGVGCHFLLQGIFLMQGLNPHHLHWQADSLLLNHVFSQRISWIKELRRGTKATGQNNNSLVSKQSQGSLVPSPGLEIIFWAISCELSCRCWNPHLVEKLITWWPDSSQGISCHNSENWPQINGNKLILELKMNCS